MALQVCRTIYHNPKQYYAFCLQIAEYVNLKYILWGYIIFSAQRGHLCYTLVECTESNKIAKNTEKISWW